MRKNITQDKMLAELHKHYNQLEELLAQLTRAEYNVSGIAGAWSVKELLAHLTAWDERGTIWIRDALRGEMPQIPAPNETWTARHRMNAETERASKRHSYARVLEEYRAAFNQLAELVESIDERDWERRTRVRHKTGLGETVSISALVRCRVQHLAWHTKPLATSIKARSKQ